MIHGPQQTARQENGTAHLDPQTKSPQWGQLSEPEARGLLSVIPGGKQTTSREMGVSQVSRKTLPPVQTVVLSFKTLGETPFKVRLNPECQMAGEDCSGATALSQLRVITNRMSGGKSLLPNKLLQNVRLRAVTVFG